MREKPAAPTPLLWELRQCLALSVVSVFPSQMRGILADFSLTGPSSLHTLGSYDLSQGPAQQA